jgi:hypothetical protein
MSDGWPEPTCRQAQRPELLLSPGTFEPASKRHRLVRADSDDPIIILDDNPQQAHNDSWAPLAQPQRRLVIANSDPIFDNNPQQAHNDSWAPLAQAQPLTLHIDLESGWEGLATSFPCPTDDMQAEAPIDWPIRPTIPSEFLDTPTEPQETQETLLETPTEPLESQETHVDTRREPHTAAIELSAGSGGAGSGGPTDDSQLCGWNSDSESTCHSESTFDSQLTENDDPNWPPQQQPVQVQNQVHHLRDPAFLDQVMEHLSCLDGKEWFEVWPGLPSLGSDWEDNVLTIRHAISELARTCDEYKVGITADLKYRWETIGYWRDFSRMVLLYTARSSKPRHAESTGSMEIRQASYFRHLPGCLNKTDGGECPSFGSPHYFYIVMR